MRLMQRIRDSIKNDCFPSFVKNFVHNYYSNGKNSEAKKPNENNGNDKKTEENIQDNQTNIPQWVINALNSVNINVLDS
jgi:hypothetical protein